MRGFWNDEDGLSVPDVLSLIIVTTYLCLILSGVFLPQYAEPIRIMLDYLKTPTTVVLTGFFGNQLVRQIPKVAASVRRIPEERKEE